MAFMMHILFFEDKDFKSIETSSIRNIFGEYFFEKNGYMDLIYDEQNWSELYFNRETEFITDLAINRPCGNIRLWDAVYELVKIEGVVIPLISAAIVGSSNTEAHLPNDIIERFLLKLAKNGNDIKTLIERS